jgi:membrane protein YdbS with pleckstrin-like domain
MPEVLAEQNKPAAPAVSDRDGSGPMQLRLPVTLQPHGNLLKYYLLTALVFPPAFLFIAVPMYFRYRTLRYDVDGEGITMRWGILFRREVSLTYARIQDIQLTSNLVERWLGLARIQLQTASGSSSAEMTIEGILDVEAMRDFLYSRMRGTGRSARAEVTPPQTAAIDAAGSVGADAAVGAVRHGSGAGRGVSDSAASLASAGDAAALAAALDAVAEELRLVRESLAERGRHGGDHG